MDQTNSVQTAKNDNATSSGNENQLDDQGTTPAEAVEVLRNLLDNEFDGSEEKLALALGREVKEIEDYLSGVEVMDADLVMKAKTLEIKRGEE